MYREGPKPQPIARYLGGNQEPFVSHTIINKGDKMEKLYEITDKGRALLANQPRHSDPTNWGHCCSCCPILERRVKILKETVERLEIGGALHE